MHVRYTEYKGYKGGGLRDISDKWIIKHIRTMRDITDMRGTRGMTSPGT